MTIALTGATIISCDGREPLDDGTVIIEGETIKWVGQTADARVASASVIDCHGKTVMPGLCDAHAHLYFDGVIDPYTLELSKPLEQAAIDAALNAAKLLRLGFTAVRDVGTRGNIAVAIRDEVQRGRLHGPRIKAAKQIISTWGGLCDHHPTHLFGRDQYRSGIAEIVTGPWEARNAVRQQVKDGVDWVKVEASGTGFNRLCPADRDTMSAEELQAVVDEATSRGRPVACHAESRNSIIKAAEAGVRTIEHAVHLDDEGLAAILARDIAICPTLALYATHARSGLEHGMHPDAVTNYQRTSLQHVASVRAAHEAGATIIAGGDSGQPNFPQGGALEEICAFVELVGMSEEQALLTATRDAARVIGFGDRGTIEPGKVADLIVLKRNPLEDIRVIAEPHVVDAVVQSGQMVVAGSAEQAPPCGIRDRG